MLRARGIEEFNKNRKIIIREVPPVTYDEVKTFMGPFGISNIAISKRQRHAIVELKHGEHAESAIHYLSDRRLLGSEVKASLFRQDNLMCIEDLPLEWGIEEFRAFVAPQGGIEKCFLYSDAEDRSLGYGFVEFVHNRELSEVARLELDGCPLYSGHVTHSRFAGDGVTAFDLLGSTCIVVSNLPIEVGLDHFQRILVHMGNGTLRPVNSQVGIATGATMERFGAAEFETHEQAVIMWRRINGRMYTSRKEESVASDAQSDTRVELRAWFCTPGETIDDIMKRMTAISITQVKGQGISQSSLSLKLVHPVILGMLKNEAKVLEDFNSVLEGIIKSNKDISSNMYNIHFQMAVFSLMMSTSQNPGSSHSYDPQKLCALTATILKSVSAGGSSKMKSIQQKKSHQGQQQTASEMTLASALSSASQKNALLPVQPIYPNIVQRQDGESLDLLLKSDLENIDKVWEALQPPPVISSTTEITSPWKLLPSFQTSHPSAMADASGWCTDEPYPGFDTDLAYVVHFLRTNTMPPQFLPRPQGISKASCVIGEQASVFAPTFSLSTNQKPSSQPACFGAAIVHPPLSVSQMAPTIQLANQWLEFKFPERTCKQAGNQPERSQVLNIFPQRGCRKESDFFKTSSCLEFSNNTISSQTFYKRKMWRPKVVEQCWNNVFQDNLENTARAADLRLLQPPPSSSSLLSMASYPNISSVVSKKRRALSETFDNKVNPVREGPLKGQLNPQRILSSPSPLLVNSYGGSTKIHPNAESASETTYVGQHQQGLGGLYADSLLRKRKFREALDDQFRAFV